MRLVSLLSTTATLYLLYALVFAETESTALGIVAAGLYAATFKTTQEFMDIARVDALFVLLAVAAVWVLRTRPTTAGRAGAAMLLVLCFLAKQSGMLVAAPLVAFVAWDAARGARTTRERLRGAPFAAIVVVGIAASVWLLDRASGGWYRYYAFDLPAGHRLVPEMWTDFARVDLMPLGLACAGAMWVLLGASGDGIDLRRRALWGAALAGVLLASFSARLHDGGWSNVLMPAYAILAALFAIALHGAFARARSAPAPLRGRLETLVGLVAVLQLAAFVYDPRTVLPKSDDARAGQRLVAVLRDAPGDVLLPSDSYLAVMAGKPPTLHEMAVNDILRGPPGEVRDQLVRDIRAAFREHRWAMVVTDDDFFAGDVVDSYRRGPESVPEPGVFFPVTGMQLRPGWVYTPR